jgi:hypothetical protein
MSRDDDDSSLHLSNEFHVVSVQWTNLFVLYGSAKGTFDSISPSILEVNGDEEKTIERYEAVLVVCVYVVFCEGVSLEEKERGMGRPQCSRHDTRVCRR